MPNWHDFLPWEELTPVSNRKTKAKRISRISGDELKLMSEWGTADVAAGVLSDYRNNASEFTCMVSLIHCVWTCWLHSMMSFMHCNQRWMPQPSTFFNGCASHKVVLGRCSGPVIWYMLQGSEADELYMLMFNCTRKSKYALGSFRLCASLMWCGAK